MIRTMKIIVDTSVLLSLAIIGRLEILARMTGNLAIPEAVYEEAVVEVSSFSENPHSVPKEFPS